MDRMLEPRAQHLLKTLIERYVSDGQPVGSRALSRHSGLELSAATVRNVMADLEEMGFITSPHTSAGRVPTAKGYRSVTWTYYDPIVQRWHRSIVDSEGERVELVGTRDGDVLTLEGDEPVPGHADARLRVVQRTDVTGVRQEWFVSMDRGATWRAARTIAFTRATTP